MSFLDFLFAEETFRAAKPAFEVGETVTAFVTGREGDAALVRVGDTILELSGAENVPVEGRVRLEIEEFDAASSRGRGRLLEVLDDRG
ncbi:DUF7513 family protein [Halopelagius longus]|uniref:DUF7513 domain-containing protein n=1 Tax=Halopelagius longus TaxID=1236180 RepID=A0A1H1AZE1_9EURY|nr:hypothetical protein [Halopelagius longus]RDI70576.1 hypothetical protein DWB78_01910 [Halopelagius longus]SDQ45029.1 hypothetical protein SAMN05216278_1561 [Halopelagius longus]